MIYLDSSAIVKLIVQEPESEALFARVMEDAERVSSALASVEVLRAVRRLAKADESLVERARSVLGSVALIRIDRPVLRAAAELDFRGLRTLDAIHLATALSISSKVSMLVYDQRLRSAASESGLTVEAPGAD